MVLNSTVRQFLLLVGMSSLLIFTFLTFLISKGRLVNTDFDLMVKVQDKVPHRWDSTLGQAVDFGSMEIMSMLVLIAVFFLPMKKRYKLMVLVLYTAGLLGVMGGKLLLHHPAPPFMFQRDGQGVLFPSSHVQIEYSYPSGHTYRTSFVLALLGMRILSSKKPDVVKLFGMGSAALVSLVIVVGLVVLGKHWVTDVLGGGLLGIGLATVGTYFMEKPKKEFSPKK